MQGWRWRQLRGCLLAEGLPATHHGNAAACAAECVPPTTPCSLPGGHAALPACPFTPSPSAPLLAACLAATLREYQLEGLRWLVQMWDAGMNAILAGGPRGRWLLHQHGGFCVVC